MDTVQLASFAHVPVCMLIESSEIKVSIYPTVKAVQSPSEDVDFPLVRTYLSKWIFKWGVLTYEVILPVLMKLFTRWNEWRFTFHSGKTHNPVWIGWRDESQTNLVHHSVTVVLIYQWIVSYMWATGIHTFLDISIFSRYQTSTNRPAMLQQAIRQVSEWCFTCWETTH